MTPSSIYTQLATIQPSDAHTERWQKTHDVFVASGGFATLFEGLLSGKSFMQCCREQNVNPGVLRAHIQHDPELSKAFEQVIALRNEALAEMILDEANLMAGAAMSVADHCMVIDALIKARAVSAAATTPLPSKLKAAAELAHDILK